MRPHRRYHHWTRGVFAVTTDKCRIHDPRAVRFCAVGALQAEYGIAGGLSDLGNLQDVPDFAPSVAVELIDPCYLLSADGRQAVIATDIIDDLQHAFPVGAILHAKFRD